MGKVESIISSLAELDTQAAINKLKEYARKISENIIKENNDQRIESLKLLEKFAFKVPEEALEIIEIFTDKKLEKTTIEYKKPFTFFGTTHKSVLEKCLEILRQYNLRYGLFDKCLGVLIKFYQFKLDDKVYENIRKRASEIITNTAEYNLKVIKPEGYPFQGYKFQELFIDKIRDMIISKDERIFNLSLSIADKLLETELEGTYWDYEKVTIRFAPVIYTDKLKKLRKNLIILLFRRIKDEKYEKRRLSLVKILENAMQFPIRGLYNDKVERMVMDNTSSIINFYMRLDFSKVNPVILQEVERQISFQKRRYTKYKGNNKTYASRIYTKSQNLLNRLRNTNFYKTYRILVGDKFHLRNGENDWSKLKRQKEEEISKMVNDIKNKNLLKWAKVLRKVAETYELKQEYEFEHLRLLGHKLGKEKPELAVKIMDILFRQDFELVSFFSDLIIGIRQSQKSYLADSCVKEWLKSGNFVLIKEIPYTYWALDEHMAKTEDVRLFEKLSSLKVSNEQRQELDFRLLRALPWVYNQNPKLSDRLILTILKRLPEGDLSFFADTLMFADHIGRIKVREWSMRTLELIVNEFLRKEILEYRDEEILAVYAEKKPLEIINFFKKRVNKSKKEKKGLLIGRYDAVPYHLGEIAKVLHDHTDYRKVIRKLLREWMLKGDWNLQWEGKHFLSGLSPNLDETLRHELFLLIRSKIKKRVLAALEVLDAYEGSSAIDELCKEAIKITKGAKVITKTVTRVLFQTGVVTGKYGFRDAYQQRLKRMRIWSKDRNKYVKLFAKEFSKFLRKNISREEERVAEETMKMKKGVKL